MVLENVSCLSGLMRMVNTLLITANVSEKDRKIIYFKKGLLA